MTSIHITVTNVKRTRERDNSKGLISDQVKDLYIVLNTKQTRKKRKKKKYDSKVESIKHKCKHNTIDIPQGDICGDLKIKR